MKRSFILISGTMLILFAFSGCGSNGSSVNGAVEYSGIDGGYVGSAVCGGCHESIKADFDKSGHPYKIRFTMGATPAAASDALSANLIGTTPLIANLATTSNNNLLVDDGTGRLDWSAVSYVIGGWGWKARWAVLDHVDNGVNPAGDSTGYVWSGNDAQYNLFTGTYSKYPGTVPADKKYECAICHNTNGKVFTTGYDCYTDPVADPRTQPWATTGQDVTNHGGFYSQWTLDGVQCEACHGPGEIHANNPSSSNIVTDTSATACGKCHIRATNTVAIFENDECGGDSNPAYLTNGAPTEAGKFGSHHQQYNEMAGYNGDGVHASLQCVTCHDPHKRSHKVPDSAAAALNILDNDLSAEVRGAIKVSCASCHLKEDTDGGLDIAGHAGITCINCHMAEATKSATSSATAGWGRKADVKSHIFKIDPDQTANTRINADGKTIATNYLTVNYACGKCHDSNIYGSVIAGPLSVAEAQAAADDYHGCTSCH